MNDGPPDGRFNDAIPVAGEPARTVAPVQPTPPQIASGGDYEVPDRLLNDKSETPKLSEALASVLKEATWVEQRGFNSFHKYPYATIDDMREYIGTRIGKHGLSYEQHQTAVRPYNIGMTGPRMLIEVVYAFRLCHVSGEKGPFEIVSALAAPATNNGAPDDKAISKARSLALKDWAKSKFSIPAGDDPKEDPDFDDRNPDTDPPHGNGRHTAASASGSASSAMGRLANHVTSRGPAPVVQANDAAPVDKSQEAKAYAGELKADVARLAAMTDGQAALAEHFGNKAVLTRLGKLKTGYATIYTDVVEAFLAEGVIDKIGYLQSKSPALYDDIVAASTKKAA